jgi:hypothetical protein
MAYYLNVDRFGNEIVETGAPDVVLTPVSYVPTSSGNANNKNNFVIDPNGEVWFIDTNGDAVKLNAKDVVTTLTNVIAGHKIGTYTNELGAVVDIYESVTSLQKFEIAGNVITIEYVDEAGNTTSKSVTLPSDVVTSLTNTLTNGHVIGTYTNENGVAVDIKETVTGIVDNGDGSFTYTDEAGVAHTIDVASCCVSGFVEHVTTLKNNGDGTFTYTNEEGTEVSFASSVAQPCLDVLTATQPTPSATGNTSNTNSVFKDAAGDTWIVDCSGDAIKAGGQNADQYKSTSTTCNDIVSTGNLTYTIATGLAYTPLQDVIIYHDANNHMHGEVVSYDAATGVIVVNIHQKTGSGNHCDWTFNLDGVSAAAETITTITGAKTSGNKIGTYNNEAGVSVDLYETITSVTEFDYDAVSGTLMLTYKDEAGVENYLQTNIPVQVITSLTNAIVGHKIGTYTNESGVAVDINETITSINDFSIAGNVITLKYIDEAGVTNTKTLTIPSDVVTSLTNTITGHLIGTYTNESGVAVDIKETISTLVDNGNGTSTYTNENGVAVTIKTPNPANWVDVTTDPSATGNTGTLPRFVSNTANGSKWYIDANGVAKLIEGAADNCGVIYFNSTDPSTATIFDTANPPVTNNNALKNLDCGLYIGSDGSAWTSNGTSYSTKVYSSPLHQRNAFFATAGQTTFTMSKIPVGDTEKVHVTRNGVDISVAWSWVGAVGTYLPANNGGKTLDANDRMMFHYEAY